MIKAAVLRKYGEPLEICDIEWEPLQFGQVKVNLIASGICGAQLQEIDGIKGSHLPRLIGHEAVGIVEEVGVGVRSVGRGDKCILHWRKGSGIECEPPHWKDYEGEHSCGQVTTFLEQTVVSENRVTAVPHDTPICLSALLGCGLSTALGVIEQEANLLFGESILIIGCGGLGVNLICAAKVRGASLVTICDKDEGKETIASSMGAVFFHGVPEGRRYDVIVDTSGSEDAIAQGISLLAPSGRFIMVGQPKPRANVMLTNACHFFEGEGKRIIATQGGKFRPEVDIPRYINLWKSGHLNIERVITDRYFLSGINEALSKVRSGEAGRILLEL